MPSGSRFAIRCPLILYALIKAIALIRAYRIRGHLNANLVPLGMMERKYLKDLHPEDYGFKKEEYDKKIFLHSYLDKGYASINELIPF